MGRNIAIFISVIHELVPPVSFLGWYEAAPNPPFDIGGERVK